MNIAEYTDNEINKNLALLENHFKQAPSGDDIFCKDCINKHLILLEGLAEEGMTAGGDSEKYQKVYDFVKETKGEDYKSRGVELANDTRQLRKSLSSCSECKEKLNPKKIEAIKQATKDLNNPSSFNNQLNKTNDKKMENKFIELGVMNAGQFAAEGVRYLVQSQLPQYEDVAIIGGGVALQALAVFAKLPDIVEKILVVAGSNLFAGGVVKLLKGTAPVVSARVGAVQSASLGGYAGKSFSYAPSFGGPTFAGRVTAENIPTRYARAGILSGAQVFESPEHADLIRVD